MKFLFIYAVALAALLSAGCSNPSIVQMSPGIYELARADHGGIFGNKDALKASVIRDANAFAEEKGKVAVPVSAKEHPVGILGDWASFEYVFKVVDRDSPESRTPTILVRSDSVHAGGFTSLGSKDTLYVAQSSNPNDDSLPGHIENNKAGTSSSSGNAAPVVSESARSTADRLLELKKLYDAGALTAEEYEAKRKILVEKL